MYLYLHNNLDPKLVQKMIRVKYPGLQDKIEIAIEKLVRRPIVTWTKDCINSSDLLKKIIQNISGLIKIEVKSIDMIKDFALTILMLRLVGGIPAIIDLWVCYCGGDVLLNHYPDADKQPPFGCEQLLHVPPTPTFNKQPIKD